MRKWNLAGLALLLAAIIFEASAVVGRAGSAPWYVLIAGAALWLAREFSEKYYENIVAIIFIKFLWILYWGLTTLAVLVYTAFLTISITFKDPVLVYSYIFFAVTLIFASLTVANLVSFFRFASSLGKILNRKTFT